jgi:hypothetical protein
MIYKEEIPINAYFLESELNISENLTIIVVSIDKKRKIIKSKSQTDIS